MPEDMQRAANSLLEVNLEARLPNYITRFMVDIYYSLDL